MDKGDRLGKKEQKGLEVTKTGEIPINDEMVTVYGEAFTVFRLLNDFRLLLLRGIPKRVAYETENVPTVAYGQEVICEIIIPFHVVKSLHEALGSQIEKMEKEEE